MSEILPTIPDYIKEILDPDGDANWYIRWEQALCAALERREGSDLIRWLVLNFEGGPNDLATKFAWISILKRSGYSREQLAELMLARFKVTDPNCDLPAMRRRDFLCYPAAWDVATNDDLAKFVEAEAPHNPTDVLAKNADLAERLGAREADRLAVLACRHADWLNDAAAATVMRIGGEDLLGVAQRMAIRSIQNQIGIFRACELAVMVYAAMAARHDNRGSREIDIWLGVREALSWPGRPPNPNRPFVVFRWMLKFAQEAPFKVEAWMRGNTPPNEVKQRRHEDFVEHLRKIMGELHYSFATVEQTEHNGQRQFAAIVTDRGGELKFIEAHRPSSRGDTIQDGTEVIVPLRPEGRPAFTYRGGRGFITNLHPVAVPTSAMEAEVKGRYGVV